MGKLAAGPASAWHAYSMCWWGLCLAALGQWVALVIAPGQAGSADPRGAGFVSVHTTEERGLMHEVDRGAL